MGTFFAELKRRQMFRVAAGYAVLAWLLLQIFNNVAPIVELPPWVGRVILIILLLGLPVTLLSVWLRQLAPARGATPTSATAKLDFALIAALIVVVGLVAYQLVPSTGGGTAQQTTVASSTPAPQPAGISIAVLPLVNLSGDPSQEFFSDSMTEEINAALAKVPNLQLVARTSAFQFKGQNRDIQVIGQQLRATHLIEGSIRKAGDQVRITAQLVRTENGLQLWSQTYDRQLTDIFAIQEDIAQAIAGALRVPLGLRQGESLVAKPTIDAETYQQYLRGRTLVRARGSKPLADAVALLEQVVSREPDYAPAWAALARAYQLMPTYHPSAVSASAEELRLIVDATLPKAEKAAQRAIQLDPSFPEGYFVLATVQSDRGNRLLTEDLQSKALALDPNNPDFLHGHSLHLASVGRVKEALRMRQQLQLLDPFVPVFNANTAVIQWLNGETDAAIAALDELPRGNAFRGYFLAKIYASAGRYDEAADVLREAPFDYPPGIRDEAVRLLRAAPAAVASPQSLPRFGNLEFVYLHVGAADRVLEYVEDNLRAGQALNSATASLWHSSYAPVRKTDRFKMYVRNAGLVDYWRVKGWPDLCRPVGTDDFVCD